MAVTACDFDHQLEEDLGDYQGYTRDLLDD